MTTLDQPHEQLVEDTERWFIRQGMPHAINDYSATEDVFTRTAPFLALVLFVELFLSFGDRFAGWAQAAAFVGGLVVLVGGLALVNLIRRRRPFQLPDDIEAPELVFFVLGPAAVPLIFSNDRVTRSIAVLVINLLVLAVAYVITFYGLFPALKVGAQQVFRQFRTVTHLIARGLPLLLLFSVVVFLNAEMWQVAHDFEPAYYAIVVPALLALALTFIALRVPDEAAALGRFDSWEAVCACAAETDSPLSAHRPDVTAGPPPPNELGRFARLNIGLLLITSHVVQVVLIGVTIGLFYVGFGLLAVREETILQWTTADGIDPLARFGFLGAELVLTWELFAVAGFIAVFSSLQFAVSVATDASFKGEFDDEVAADVRRILAVRALYRTLV